MTTLRVFPRNKRSDLSAPLVYILIPLFTYARTYYVHTEYIFTARTTRYNFFEHETTVRSTRLLHRVRIKCSNAFYGAKSIVCNNDRATYLLVLCTPTALELSGGLVGCMNRIYLSAFVQMWNYMRAVRRKCTSILASPFFSLCIEKINCGCVPSA